MVCFSPILNDLYKPASRATYPGSLSTLRSPASPGRASRKLSNAASGSAKMFGLPLTSPSVVETGRTRTKPDERFQFVGQRWNPNGRFAVPVGAPEFQRKIPVNCHPPKMPFTTLPELFRNVLP